MRFNFNKFSSKKPATKPAAEIVSNDDPDVITPPTPVARMLSKKVIFSAVGVVGVVFVVIMFAAATTGQKSSSKTAIINNQQLKAASADQVEKAIGAALDAPKPLPAAASGVAAIAGQQTLAQASGGDALLQHAAKGNAQATIGAKIGDVLLKNAKAQNVVVPALSPIEQAKQQQQTKEVQDAQAALSAPLNVSGFGMQQAATAPSSQFDPNAAAKAYAAGAASHMPTPQQPAQQGDTNEQDRKKGFLAEASSQPDSEWLPEAKKAMIGKYEIKAGSVIPGVLISGINSDLPGMIIAQVSQNVFDTKSGARVLIPQGTRIVGTYDSGVTYGQKRALVVWNRIIFPDATSLTLKGMPGSDAAGFAGFADQVDNHYWKIFGSAAAMSVFSAAAQLSQPQQQNSNGNNNAPTMGQTMAASLGQQLGQVGSQMAQKNMAVQPTIVIRPGYEFDIMITRDIVLDPYNS